MKWFTLLEGLDDQPLFDLHTAVRLSGSPRPQVAAQISRWIGSGKLIPLRRGLYSIGDVYRS